MRIIYTQFTRTYTVVVACDGCPTGLSRRTRQTHTAERLWLRVDQLLGNARVADTTGLYCRPAVRQHAVLTRRHAAMQIEGTRCRCWFVAAAELPLEPSRALPCLASVHRVEAYKQANRQS